MSSSYRQTWNLLFYETEFSKTLSAAKPYPAMVSAIFDTLSCKLIHLYVSCSLPSCLCIYPDLSLFPMMGTKTGDLRAAMHTVEQ